MLNASLSQLGRHCLVDVTSQGLKDFASLFYLFDIHDSIKETAEEVPNYEILLFPSIAALILFEQLLRVLQRKELTRFEDGVINIGSSLLFSLCRIFLYVVVVKAFDFLYSNYRIVDLPLHSVTTWLISLLLVEFVYYWTHRALHEFNILWAAHQFHHMAEDINITTTVRDSVVDLVIYDIFPIPLALIVPPPILALHMQFSLIYQVWLHNEVIGHLGPLEYVINTPRQHRVHHGKNPYCIDKNYGALLMIFDRLFGTYQEEIPQQKIVFGCVAPVPKHFDSLGLQFGYYVDVAKKFSSMTTFSDKMSSLLKGPGWAPGKPRLGLLSDVPEPDPMAPKYGYQPVIATWKKVYIYFHGFIIAMGFYMMADHPLVRFSPAKGFICMLYVLLALTSFGAIFDNRWFVHALEIYRCLVYFAFDYYLIAYVPWPLEGPVMTAILTGALWIIRLFHVASIIFWVGHFFCTNQNYINSRRFRQKRGQKESENTKVYPSNGNLVANKETNKSDAEVNCIRRESTTTTSDSTIAETETLNKQSSPNNLKSSTVMLLLSLVVFSALVSTFLYFCKIESCARMLEEVGASGKGANIGF